MQITGKVIKGLGEGQFYVNKYNPLFLENLGFEAFPGTINIQTEELPNFQGTNKLTIIPQDNGKVDCFPIKINNIHKGAIVIPHKTTHQRNVIEIITPNKLQINEGDEITCELV